MTLDRKDQRILQEARETYGLNAELLVAIEELSELSAIVAKIPRYKTIEAAQDALKNRVLDEYVDVIIVLDHIRAAMDITEYQFEMRKNEKLERVERWLATGSDIAISTIIRE